MVRSTKSHVPLILAHQIPMKNEKEARACERRLKDKRIEKEALIRHIEGVV
jgi:hypothetical protein